MGTSKLVLMRVFVQAWQGDLRDDKFVSKGVLLDESTSRRGV